MGVQRDDKMIRLQIAVVIVSAFAFLTVPTMRGHAQDTASTQAAPKETPSPMAGTMPPADAKTRRTELERQFAEMLTGATLRGMWQMTGEGGLTGKEPLTEPKGEAYHIVSASKLSDDIWIISARIEVGEKNVTVPVPVRVEWAGDTPVITLDDIPIPTMGTYSARVMFHRGFYSGTWLSNAKNYGGIMAGRIVKEEAGKPETPDATAAPKSEQPEKP